jgi:hypothetical protein
MGSLFYFSDFMFISNISVIQLIIKLNNLFNTNNTALEKENRN